MDKNENIETAKKTAWKASIFATDKFTNDLRRSNTVRDIFNQGFEAGYKAQSERIESLEAALRAIPNAKHRNGYCLSCGLKNDIATAALKEERDAK